MNGLLIVDKPEGMTSAEVVRRAKRLLKAKTGHLGTLDPFATGVLPLCVGEGTKVAQFLNDADKEYVGVMQLGAATDTGDPTGTVVERASVPALTAGDLERAVGSFSGRIDQVPPMYSAIKQHGRPLYELARRGMEVERSARPVIIHRLHLELLEKDRLAFTVACSKGVYVRVLASDIAEFLGTKGHLRSLRRTRFGRFGLDDAVALNRLTLDTVKLIGLAEALGHLREVRLHGADVVRARRGFVPLLRALPGGKPGERVRLSDEEGRAVAVVVCGRDREWRYARVLL